MPQTILQLEHEGNPSIFCTSLYHYFLIILILSYSLSSFSLYLLILFSLYFLILVSLYLLILFSLFYYSLFFSIIFLLLFLIMILIFLIMILIFLPLSSTMSCNAGAKTRREQKLDSNQGIHQAVGYHDLPAMCSDTLGKTSQVACHWHKTIENHQFQWPNASEFCHQIGLKYRSFEPFRTSKLVNQQLVVDIDHFSASVDHDYANHQLKSTVLVFQISSLHEPGHEPRYARCELSVMAPWRKKTRRMNSGDGYATARWTMMVKGWLLMVNEVFLMVKVMVFDGW